MRRAVRQWFLNLSLAAKLILIFSMPFLFLGLVSSWTVLVFEEFDAAEGWVLLSNHIRTQAVSYQESIVSLQNAFRGYVITEDRGFLAVYHEYKGDLDLAGFELERLVKDSPLQSQRDLVSDVQTLTRRLIQEKDDVIARLQSGTREDAMFYIKSNRGKELVDGIFSLLNLFQTVAVQIQNERQAAVEAKRVIFLRVTIGGAILTLLLTGLGAVIVARSMTTPLAALAQATRDIGESGFAPLLEADRQDEIGVLSRAMDAMQRRLAPAERLAAMTRMATSIAHDLRTPLLGIEQGLKGLQYMAAPQLDSKAQQLLGDLHVGSQLAVGIVQDILDLYRQAYGVLPLSYSRFMLDDLAKEAIELMSAEVRDRHLAVSVEGSAPAVWADRRRLFRVLVNLLDNAIKNSPMGGSVSVVITDHGEGASRRAIVAVDDEGSGLDPAALEDLFEPSRPISPPTRSGTGLGLYVCRLVIGAHQGTLGVQNRAEGGARFAFDIPVEETHVHPTPDRRRPASV